MKKSKLHPTLWGAAASLSLALLSVQAANACTRAVYLGPEDTNITVRSMDWKTDLHSNLWAFPRGMQREGAAGPQSMRWTSKYGSVVTSAFEAATADGMNEKGLVANLLYLAEADYVKPAANDKRLPQLPDVPTFAELGLKGVEASAQVGLVGPAALPVDVKAALQKQVAAAIQQPQVRQKLIEFGVEPVGSSTQAYADLIKSETVRWHKLIKERGITLD